MVLSEAERASETAMKSDRKWPPPPPRVCRRFAVIEETVPLSRHKASMEKKKKKKRGMSVIRGCTARIYGSGGGGGANSIGGAWRNEAFRLSIDRFLKRNPICADDCVRRGRTSSLQFFFLSSTAFSLLLRIHFHDTM